MNQLLEQFLNEARDNLHYLDENLETLKDETCDIDALFRAAHTLKGGAGLVGFGDVQKLTHRAEDLLDMYRRGALEYTPRLPEVLFDLFDSVVELLDDAEAREDIPPEDPSLTQPLIEKADAMLHEKQDERSGCDTSLPLSKEPPKPLRYFTQGELSETLKALPEHPPFIDEGFINTPNYYLLDCDLDVDTITLGNDPFYLLSLFEKELKHIKLEIAQSCEEIEQNPLHWATRIVAILCSDEETIEDICENVLDEIALYPLDREGVEAVYGKAPESAKGTESTPVTRQKPAVKTAAIGKTVKIEQEQIDNLMDTIGELLVMKNSMPYIVQTLNADTMEQSKRDILSKYDQISRVTSQLQEIVMSMRLLPLSYIFGRYPKLVRDLSKQLGKKIKYEESGGETKLDKTMIESLADPMIHLIRNSLDHGIESAQERLDAGKAEAGTISIEACSEGDKVFITIKDDGKGIDEEAILHKALENGLVSRERAQQMGKTEILQLIFHAGLTTKKQISDLSGRGVGMDAVKTAIENLNGTIAVDSQKSEGTTITLELPVSVALTNVFHIKMNDTDYAIAMDYLIETSQIEKNQIQESNKKPFLQRRGELLPITYPKALIGSGAKEQEQQKVIVLQSGEKKFAMVVDEFVNQLDVVQKPLSGALQKHPIISGSSLLGNGSVLFILDVNKLSNVASWQ